MNDNLYWTVYKNLEREIIDLSNLIHIDDKQLEIYSIKISELLIRTVVEVESISKELYFQNRGIKLDNKDLFFDTDCLELLENKWLLSKKQVQVSAPNFYFDLVENKVLTPLKKANKRGTSSSDWLKSYQAVKHNRAKSLREGNLKHLIRAMAGLYVLNLYYKDNVYDLGKDGTGTNFDNNLASSIFSIRIHINQSSSIDTDYSRNIDFDECVYILKTTDETRSEAQNSLGIINTKINERTNTNLIHELEKQFLGIKINDSEGIKNKVKTAVEKIKRDISIQVARENDHLLQIFLEGLKYEAVLNKQQY